MAENKNTTENNKNSTIPENNEQLLERIMEKTQDEFLDESEESSENTEDIKDTEETEGKEEQGEQAESTEDTENERKICKEEKEKYIQQNIKLSFWFYRKYKGCCYSSCYSCYCGVWHICCCK